MDSALYSNISTGVGRVRAHRRLVGRAPFGRGVHLVGEGIQGAGAGGPGGAGHGDRAAGADLVLAVEQDRDGAVPVDPDVVDIQRSSIRPVSRACPIDRTARGCSPTRSLRCRSSCRRHPLSRRTSPGWCRSSRPTETCTAKAVVIGVDLVSAPSVKLSVAQAPPVERFTPRSMLSLASCTRGRAG